MITAVTACEELKACCLSHCPALGAVHGPGFTIQARFLQLNSMPTCRISCLLWRRGNSLRSWTARPTKFLGLRFPSGAVLKC